MRICIRIVIYLTTLSVLSIIILWSTQIRYVHNQISNFSNSHRFKIKFTSPLNKQSLLQLSQYLNNKVILIDPRLILERQGIDQTRIGEEKLNDTLEQDVILMAFNENDRLEILHLLGICKLNWKQRPNNSIEVELYNNSYHLIPFVLSDTADYYKFILQNVTRIIPRFQLVRYESYDGTLMIPENWTKFGWYLRHSRFISCLTDYASTYRKLYPELFHVKPKIKNEIILTLRKFRDWAIDRITTPMLYAGTLLGWYRECGIITHTHDVDFALFIEEYYDGFAHDINQSSFMRLSMRFNKPEELLEYKVYINNDIPMDIFFIYHDQNGSWTGGLGVNEKYKYHYPLIDQTCATDFLGYLMYVPCNPLELILSEHGENWTKPLHSDDYKWYLSPHNIELVDTFTEDETDLLFMHYSD